MKLLCIKDRRAQLQFRSLKFVDTKIDGLTKDKVYPAFAVSISNGNLTRFVVFNDCGEWVNYEPDLFQPWSY